MDKNPLKIAYQVGKNRPKGIMYSYLEITSFIIVVFGIPVLFGILMPQRVISKVFGIEQSQSIAPKVTPTPPAAPLTQTAAEPKNAATTATAPETLTATTPETLTATAAGASSKPTELLTPYEITFNNTNYYNDKMHTKFFLKASHAASTVNQANISIKLSTLSHKQALIGLEKAYSKGFAEQTLRTFGNTIVEYKTDLTPVIDAAPSLTMIVKIEKDFIALPIKGDTEAKPLSASMTSDSAPILTAVQATNASAVIDMAFHNHSPFNISTQILRARSSAADSQFSIKIINHDTPQQISGFAQIAAEYELSNGIRIFVYQREDGRVSFDRMDKEFYEKNKTQMQRLPFTMKKLIFKNAAFDLSQLPFNRSTETLAFKKLHVFAQKSIQTSAHTDSLNTDLSKQ